MVPVVTVVAGLCCPRCGGLGTAVCDSPVEGTTDADAPIDGGPDRIWVYILAGQSNMVGLGINESLSPENSAPVSGASIYDRAMIDPNPHTNQWLPLGPGFGETDDMFGPELAFGRRMREKFPGRRLAIIKMAEGATRLFDRWKAPTGDLYQLLLSETYEQLQVLACQGQPQVAGFIWMQGEADAVEQGAAQDYQQNLTQFILELRTDLGNAHTPMVAGLISTDAGWPYADLVRRATVQVSDCLDRMDVVETDDLPVSGAARAHYTSDGYITLGERFADSMTKVQTSCSGL